MIKKFRLLNSSGEYLDVVANVVYPTHPVPKQEADPVLRETMVSLTERNIVEPRWYRGRQRS